MSSALSQPTVSILGRIPVVLQEIRAVGDRGMAAVREIILMRSSQDSTRRSKHL
jgi:hypothetical protein